MELTEKFYWVKVLLALVMAAVFSILQSLILAGSTIFLLGIILYFPLSDFLGRKFGLERSSALKIGVGAYFFTWLAAWIIIFTLLNLPP